MAQGSDQRRPTWLGMEENTMEQVRPFPTIDIDERQRKFSDFVDEQKNVLLCKGHDYTAGESQKDVYYNFRKVAELLDGAPITPYTVAMIYFLKHIFSIITFAKTGVQESGEGLRGRHIDIGNYNFILDQLIKDHEKHFEEEGDV